METKCLRCKGKESIFACMECDKFRFLCGRCDNYVHSLPNKSKHKRVAITKNEESIGIIEKKASNGNIAQSMTMENMRRENNEVMNISSGNGIISQISCNNDNYMSNSFDNRNKNSYYMIDNENNNQPMLMSMQIPNQISTAMPIQQQHNNNQLYPNDLPNSNRSVNIQSHSLNQSIVNPLNPTQSSSQSQSLLQSPYPTQTQSYSNEYSKNYLNELKSIYQKDKFDLQYQSNTLLGVIEKLKISFTEQISTITNEIQKYQSNTELSTQTLETNLNSKFANSFNEKEIQVSLLKATIADLEKHNNDLTTQLTTSIESFRQKETEYQRQIKINENNMLQKEEELFMTKGNLQDIVNHSDNKIHDETNSLKISYEKKIQIILNEADRSRDNLLKVISERENDIRSLIETNRNQRDEMSNTIAQLRKENEEHRDNICAVLMQKNQLEEDVKYLTKGNNQFANQLQEQEQLLCQIRQDNNIMLEENNALKEKVDKYEGILYGKVKPNTTWK